MFSKNIPLAFAFILYGIFTLISYFEIIFYKEEIIISYVMIYFGIHSFYREMTQNHKRAIGGIVSFLLGIIIFILTKYSIIGYIKLVLPSLCFILSIIFFYLFLQTERNYGFLFSAIIFLLISLLVIIFKTALPFLEFINSMVLIFIKFWYVIAIIIGFEMLIDRKKSVELPIQKNSLG